MKSRGEEVGNGQTIQLKVIFRDDSGLPADLIAFPSIRLSEPNGTIYLDYTSTGVYRITTGTYAFDFTVPINGPQGIWTDSWTGSLDLSTTLSGMFNFIVSNAMLPGPHDGYVQLGDPPVTANTLSQAAIININVIMDILKKRLQSSGWHRIKDEYGNWVTENCDIFSVDELFAFLCSSLSEFNTTPHHSDVVWEDNGILQFRDILAEGAYIMALASKGLIEKGREFTISDNGISFQPPAVADYLNSQMSTLLSAYREKLRLIKISTFKPLPLGLGGLTMQHTSPSISRLRHLRARRFY